MSTSTEMPFAVITGASSGIGLELAKLAAADGYALLLAADRPFDHSLAELAGAAVETVSVDLSTPAGVATLDERIGRRRVDVLCANAGQGFGHAFLDQNFAAVRSLVGRRPFPCRSPMVPLVQLVPDGNPERLREAAQRKSLIDAATGFLDPFDRMSTGCL